MILTHHGACWIETIFSFNRCDFKRGLIMSHCVVPKPEKTLGISCLSGSQCAVYWNIIQTFSNKRLNGFHIQLICMEGIFARIPCGCFQFPRGGNRTMRLDRKHNYKKYWHTGGIIKCLKKHVKDIFHVMAYAFFMMPPVCRYLWSCACSPPSLFWFHLSENENNHTVSCQIYFPYKTIECQFR